MMPAEPITAACGAALLTAALVRRGVLRRSVVRRLESALRDPDPAVRAAAVQTAGEGGVGRNAGLLLAATEREADIWVRQVIAQTVQRHQWEPAATRALVELRIWAKRELNWGRIAPAEPATLIQVPPIPTMPKRPWRPVLPVEQPDRAAASPRSGREATRELGTLWLPTAAASPSEAL